MRDALTQKSDGFMPREIAVTLLTSNQSKTNSFRKRCLRAMERVCEPVSRSTALNVSAPKTGQQRLDSRLKRANAAQLHKWAKRTLARGERFQDLLAETADEKLVELLGNQIAAHDGLGQAIAAELTMRSARGIGYRKPVKWAGRYIVSLGDAPRKYDLKTNTFTSIL